MQVRGIVKPSAVYPSFLQIPAWLTIRSENFGYLDFKNQGLPVAEIDRWMALLSYEQLLNRRVSTRRLLGEMTQSNVILGL